MKGNRVEITRANSECVLGFSSGVAVAIWRRETKTADVLELQTTAERAYAAAKQPIALVQIISASAIPPDAEVRTAIAQMLARLLGRVSHSAIVHEAEGFRAAMVRSIVTGLVALSNPGFPHRVFSTVGESVSWMTTENRAIEGSNVLFAVQSLRVAAQDDKRATKTATVR